MSKESAKKILGVFKWLYIIEGVLLVAFSLLFFTNPNADFMKEVLKNYNFGNIDGLNPAIAIGVVLVISAIINFIQAWLFKRVINDGKKSTLLMILLCLIICAAIYTLIVSFKMSNVISLALDVLALIAVVKLRNEN